MKINTPLELHATNVRLAKGLCVVKLLENFCRIASLYLVLKGNISMRRTTWKLIIQGETPSFYY